VAAGYRRTVRLCYAKAGIETEGPLTKRVTAGVAYWVRQLLIEEFGETKLRELGVLRQDSFASVTPRSFFEVRQYDDPDECFATVVRLLNSLAVDPSFMPSEDALRSAVRAISLIQSRRHIIAASSASLGAA